jgi:uncharacterized protein DUF5818
MRRWSIMIAALVFPGTLVLAQQPAPSHDQLFSSDLVLWSYMQGPQQLEQSQGRQQPTPEPQPETQPSQNPTPAQPGHQAPPSAESQPQTAQTFTGLINKEGDSFVLKVSEKTSYRLDNQDEVQQFEGKRVRVTGILDSSINLIHVDKIEPLT